MRGNWNVSTAGAHASHECWKPRTEENSEFQCSASLQCLVCFPWGNLYPCSNFLIYIDIYIEEILISILSKLEKPHLVCAGDAASHHITLLARDGPQRGHKNWQGRCWTWSNKVETSTSQWSEINHIKNMCLMCVCMNTQLYLHSHESLFTYHK